MTQQPPPPSNFPPGIKSMKDFDKLEMEEAEERRSLIIFGRNVAEIPCFRNTFLYSTSGGILTGFAAFMATSRPRLSTHIGFGTFWVSTFAYWFHCRYEYSSQKFLYNQLKSAMKQQAIYEGTGLEKELEEKSENV